MSDEFLPVMHDWTDIFMRRSMHSFIQFAKKNGLSISQISGLMHLKRAGMLGVSDIADHLGVTSAASSQLIDRLVQQGLLLRNEDPVDRRLKQIELTDKGRTFLQMMIREREKWLADLVAVMNPEEVRQATETLKMLIEKTRQLDEIPHPDA